MKKLIALTMLIAFSFNISSETYLKCDSGKKKFSVGKLLDDQIKVKKIKPRAGKYKNSDGVYARAEPQDKKIFFYLIVLGETLKGERVDLMKGMDLPQESLEALGDARWLAAPADKKKICSYYLGHTNKVPPFKESWKKEDATYYKEDDNCHEWDISTEKYEIGTKNNYSPYYFEYLQLDRESLKLEWDSHDRYTLDPDRHFAYCSISTQEEHEKIRQKYQDFLAPFKKAEVQSLKEMEEDIKDNQKI